MMWWKAALVMMVGVMTPESSMADVPASGGSDPVARGIYMLGPQDRLTIRVNSLRRNTGEIYTWQPLSSDFSIGADGTIFMPIIGQLGAAGKTPDALASDISLALKNVANLAEMPFATVEVLSYRPFFIMGAVQSPGRYEYQPGVTVLQAISTAEGFARSSDIASVERDAVVAAGNVRTLEMEGVSLEAGLVRLTAESIGQEEDLVFPVEFVARVGKDPKARTVMNDETQRFQAGLAALQAELAAIESSKLLLQRELVSLKEKSGTLDSQQALYDEELKVSSALLDRGLAVSSRQIAAENSRLAVQSSLLDVQLATLRAQQSLQRSDRDSIDLRARYRKDALDNLVVTRAQLEQNRQQQRTAQDLLTMAMARSLQMVDTSDLGGFSPEYRVIRMGAAGKEEHIVGDDFILTPGDVLQVGLKANGTAVSSPQILSAP